jgi:hypothetical protein
VTMRAHVLAFALWIVPLASSWADPSVICTTDPIIFGNASVFELRGGYMGWNAGQPTWQITWTVGTCSRIITRAETSTTLTEYNQYYGKLKVKCTIEYNNGSGGQKQTFSPEAEIDVPPPDGVRRVGGPASTRFGTRNPATFQIRCKGQDSFYMNVYLVQELITKPRNPTTNRPLNIPGGGWVPRSPLVPEATLFGYAGNGTFIDRVGYPDDPNVRPYGAGTGLLTCRQDFQIILLDPCGNPMKPIPLGGVTLTITKDSQDEQGGTYTTSYN